MAIAPPGNVTSKIDQRLKAETTHAYDALNRLIGINPRRRLDQRWLHHLHSQQGKRIRKASYAGNETLIFENQGSLDAVF